MSGTDPRVEFLDPDEQPGGVWIGDGDGDEGSGDEGSGDGSSSEERIEARGGARLPLRAAWRRMAAGALVLGLALGATTGAAIGAYHRDLAAERAAATLALRAQATGDPVTVPDTAALGVPGTWRIDPSTSVEVDLVNLSPDAVTLLPGAVLRGPGVTAGTLDPSGSGRLTPGQVGRLEGSATVDCGLIPAPAPAAAHSTLLVRARLANGAVGLDAVALGGGGESVRDQICLRQGEGVVAGFFPESADPVRHTFTILLSALSLAVDPLRYTLVVQYANAAGGEDLGSTPATSATGRLAPRRTASQGAQAFTLGAPAPVGSVAGLLEPGASVSGGFIIDVTHCPNALPEEDVDVDLQLIVDDSGRPVLLRADAFDLATLVEAACGRYR
jgi:hypothetical protein